MTSLNPIRKIFQGVTTRQQMFSLLDRHARRPNQISAKLPVHLRHLPAPIAA